MSQMARLLSIMDRLRDKETGCEWDRAQDFKSIAPYTIEEAYEVADAIAKDDMAELKEELGDLLFQVVFHSQMAAERKSFDFHEVVDVISDKMETRHPHIFGGESGKIAEKRWEEIKERERANKGAQSGMDGIALALPALLRSEKLQKRAARAGFDWHDAKGPIAKFQEELEELQEAETDEERLMEAGDLLFVAVNIVRKFGIAPEDALRASNGKFEKRFRAMETFAEGKFADLSLDEKEALWQQVKRAE